MHSVKKYSYSSPVFRNKQLKLSHLGFRAWCEGPEKLLTQVGGGEIQNKTKPGQDELGAEPELGKNSEINIKNRFS